MDAFVHYYINERAGVRWWNETTREVQARWLKCQMMPGFMTLTGVLEKL